MEQRSQPRVPCTLSVQVHAPSEEVLLFTYATDLSRCGVFVRANRPLPVGTQVQLQLYQTRGERVSVDGVVVRSLEGGPRGMGLEFVGTNDKAADQLSRLLSRVNLQGMAPPADADAFIYHRS